MVTMAAHDAGVGAVQTAQQYNARMDCGTNFWDLPLPNEIREYVPKLLAFAFIIRNAA
ncbi:hypothetical protein [Coxiella-like endosymbiont of Rhipicephalus sanguineus]|uniref:hypothetical protein n=1 Tax=Coxiella-like endosymbiont of Rhipicephalus sanguineus TaxID=1955402 RepID=UPI00203EA0D0|nr:hypothetical protein [Coxiella-like endosymbiont of Rhipicephalus sanguineus]